MMFYFVKTPAWLKKVYSRYVWDLPAPGGEVYLTFDDGPHLEATPFVLNELRKYGAQATFFCIGKNVEEYAHIYQQLLDEGHAVGNHTYSHLNGWRTGNELYFEDIRRAADLIDSSLFRPPYGKIAGFQAKHLHGVIRDPSIIMWDVLSADFDEKISPQRCLENVIFNLKPGSIVIFHDSEKAFPRLKFVLPRVLEYCRQKGFTPKIIPQGAKKHS